MRMPGKIKNKSNLISSNVIKNCPEKIENSIKEIKNGGKEIKNSGKEISNSSSKIKNSGREISNSSSNVKNSSKEISNSNSKVKNCSKKIDILMIDNYDSFTFNLVQYLGILGENIKVRRNDRIGIDEIKAMAPSKIVISPGPGRPREAGISKKVIEYFCKDIPILGVCLGHQCIAEVFGAGIINSGVVVHGKTSMIYHDGRTIFNEIENPFEAARYHSLIIDRDTLSSEFEISARTKDGIIMGIRHKKYNLEGVQFHPESFLTACGLKILKNFIES